MTWLQKKPPLNYSNNTETASELIVAEDSGVISAFANNLNQLLEKSVTNQQLLKELSSGLADNGAEISSTASSIEQQLQQLGNKASEAKNSIEGIQEVISLATSVANDATSLAEKSEDEGSSGKVVMTEAISSVMVLVESVNDAGDIVESLGDESKSIGGIIEVIKGVAEQTNLLALNAAIEAARAGEQGRGFAVVADEVRSLANQTQNSAEKIESIISQLLQSISKAAEIISKSIDVANESEEQMEEVIMSYSELVGYMSEVSALANRLQQATSQEIHSVTNVVQQLDSIQASSNESLVKINSISAVCLSLGMSGSQIGHPKADESFEPEVKTAYREESNDIEMF